MNKYIEKVLEDVRRRDAHEPEFIQAVDEVLLSLEPAIEAHPEYEKLGLLERLVEPERVVSFRVPWMDDKGQARVNRGFRVQFSSAIGPYKGGLRFASHVNLSVMKFLAFEQTFKNSLTTLPMGGGKGGSDFDPNGKSDNEIMRFCQSFMTELQRHIGPSLDVPAGDIGVGGREIGFMFGQYKRIRNAYENGVITGKGLSYGGSLIRPEATGFGAVYYLREVLAHENDTVAGKRVAISGFGNVSWGVCIKIAQLGGKVVTLAGPDGYIVDEDGVSTQEKWDYLLEMRSSGRNRVQDYAEKFGVPFFAGQKPWGVAVDICMPCAYQNELGMAEVKQIVANGVKYYMEVANMPTTPEALAYLESNGVICGPGKAVNAGGVAVSGLEMSQNAGRLGWPAEEVDKKLVTIMKDIHDASVRAAEKVGLGYNLIAGANLAGFAKVAEAMIAQGLV
ncbi:MAG: NADP-specific glutamate dehydrogenase [Clostridiales bacterium]|nr:NADP-specific glutamate dehydrogenase [Clostridiales bacterium]